MMTYKLFVLIFACIVTFSVQAQTNLVRNPSFETTNTCATGAYWGIDTLWSDSPSAYRTAQYWISPNNESPDYYNSCQTDGLNLSVPGNWFGYQYPHTGNAYIGITSYSLNPVFNPHGEFREYIQARLTKKLEPGALYCGQFFMSLTYVTAHQYNAVAIGDMAMTITKQQPLNDNRPVLEVPNSHTAIISTPQITQQTSISRDTGVWQQIQGVFKAQGGEEWITIGNFSTLETTDTVIVRLATDSASRPIFISYYFIDNVSLVKVSDPIFTAHDTAICQFPSTIIARGGFDQYIWNTGDTTQTIQVNTPGKYWVKVKLADCGEVTDTIHVTVTNHISLEVHDTIVCPALLPLTLAAPAGLSHYIWSDGQEGLSASFATGGIYSVEAESTCGLQRDSFTIQVLQEVPDFDLGTPVNLCQDEQNIPIELTPLVALPNYTWSTGAQNPSILASEPGQYWLRSRNTCGEKSDSILVTGCPSQIYIPNVFSPNDDGENDYFTVFGRSISNVTLSIFNRWGELIYQENGDNLKGWDGTYKSRPLTTGVFVYLVTYVKEDSAVLQQMSGSLLLVQ